MSDHKLTKQNKNTALRHPHWYHVTAYVCPVCFRTQEVKERRYGERPSNPEDRRLRIDDMCSSHLLHGA